MSQLPGVLDPPLHSRAIINELLSVYKRNNVPAIEQQFSGFDGNVLYSELQDFLNHGHEWIAAYMMKA